MIIYPMASLVSSPEVPSIFNSLRTEVSVCLPLKTQPRDAKCFSNSRASYCALTRFRLRASVKDFKQDVSLLGRFSAPARQGSSAKQSGEGKENKNYHVNIGYAIRTLREDLPALFSKEPNFDIYRDDIAYKDPLYTFMGIGNYKVIFRALRFHGKILFKSLWMDIIGIWQPVESVIMVRWTVHGMPRVPWEAHGRFDGVSEYKLDKAGKIYEHRVHNIAPTSRPKFQVLSVHELIQFLGCPSTPKPTYFEIQTSQVSELSWIEDYLASTGKAVERVEEPRRTLAGKCNPTNSGRPS